MNNAHTERSLAKCLDAGLLGAACVERMALLRHNLDAPNSSAPIDPARLDQIVEELRRGGLTVRSAARQYQSVTDTGRWPILVVRPTQLDLEAARDAISEAGFAIDEHLTPAYAEVNLLPVRVPPEPIFIEALAALSCVDRVERSWMRGVLPEPTHHDDQGLHHPDHLLDRTNLPSELVSKRDPLRVALIDSGVDATHPALKTRLLDQRTFRRGLTGVGDQIGHGTAVAGIAARLCAAATFISAKVMDNKREPNLDDVIRAIGWLRRHKPDVLLCSILFPGETDGRSIVSGLLGELVRNGTVVVVPAHDAAGRLSSPADAQRVISVCTHDAPPGGAATLRAAGHPVLAPRSIQANNTRFPTLDVPKWTALGGPAAAAAITAGTAALMIRAARLCRVHPTPRDVLDGLLDAYDVSGPGAFSPDAVLNLYVSRVTTLNLATQTGRMALASLQSGGITPPAPATSTPYARPTPLKAAPAIKASALASNPYDDDDQDTQAIGGDLLASFRQHDAATVQHDIATLAAGMPGGRAVQEEPTVQGHIPAHLFGDPDAETQDAHTRPMELSHLTQLRGNAKPVASPAYTTVDGREHPPLLDLSRRGETEDTRRELAAESWPDNTQQLRIIPRE